MVFRSAKRQATEIARFENMTENRSVGGSDPWAPVEPQKSIAIK
jgi:hypothetical protein